MFSVKNTKVVPALAILGAIFFSSAALAENYGAFALSLSDGKWGGSFQSVSRGEAEDVALDYCRRNGGTQCQVKLWFTGTASFVRDSRGNWGMAHAEDGRSLYAAGQICMKKGGFDCKEVETISAKSGRASPEMLPRFYAGNVSDFLHIFAAGHVNRQVGNGECWTLVNDGLAYARGQQPGIAPFGTYEYGVEVYNDYKRGDVMQFENVMFRYDDGTTYSFPKHTAIIEKIDGLKVTVLHQNFNGNRTVQRLGLDIAAMKQGIIRVYRPQAKTY